MGSRNRLGQRQPLALIGCGAIMELGHAPALGALTDRCQVRAVLDVVPARRDLLGDRFGVPERDRYGDLDDLLNRIESCTLAVVALPTPVAGRAVAAVAAAGLPVLVEKPLAPSAAVARTLPGTADIHVVHNYLYRSQIQMAVRLVGDGVIGTPRFIRLEQPDAGHFPGRGTDPDWRRTGSVGCLADNAYHWVYVAEALAGAPVRVVSAELARPGTDARAEDLAVLTMRHDNDVLTCVQTAWCVAEGIPVLEVHGTGGSLQMLNNGGCRITTPQGRWEETVAHRESSYLTLYREVLAGLESGGGFGASLTECIHVLSTLDAAYESAAKGRSVTVAEAA